MFKPVASKVSFPQAEEAILALWRERHIFERSVEERKGRTPFILYEGPPTANANPGVHHVLARVFKDVIPRHKTMKGYWAPRKGGWDTHGLPVELEVERELGFTSKTDIEAYGVDKFNAKCQESVFRYVQDWVTLTERIGFWIDMDNPYITFQNDYIESCWWILRQLWDRGLIYTGHKVTPHCPRCGTSISSHEVALGYKDDTPDPAVYVRLRLRQDVQPVWAKDALERLGYDFQRSTWKKERPSLLVWTTTPWTLTANVAAAVAPDATYALVEGRGPQGVVERLILAKSRLSSVPLADVRIVGEFQGRELAGLIYEPLYSFLPAPGAHRIVPANFVSMEEGTGIVHIAPAYGEEDLELGQAEALPVIHTVDLSGNFVAEVHNWAGRFVKEADPEILDDLRERGLLFHSDTIRHTYPFCWRCDTPLLYYAKSSWYIKTTAFKNELIAGNERISWYPEHIKHGRFGDWLENNVDWAITRERYWGTPFPVWQCPRCHHYECIGSRAELASQVEVEGWQNDLDLHRPYIDEVTFLCPRCRESKMRRLPEVIDCWFDSGAMPVAQGHHPFEDGGPRPSNFPADYICEAVDQTRGWFYSLHAISTLLYQEPSYRNVICLGHILDAQGEKMSKSKGNVVDPWQVLNTHGADALRWYLFTACPPGNPRRFSVELVGETVRKFLLTLRNIYSFFVTYANIDGYHPATWGQPSELADLDRWILSQLQVLVRKVDENLEDYNPTDGARAIEAFVDELSNWYVRRSRRRFWKSENDADKLAAYSTLHRCLVTLAHLLAPFTPFIAEEMYQNLVRSVDSQAAESVHLASFPTADPSLVDKRLAADSQLAMRIASLGRAARSVAGMAGSHTIPPGQRLILGIKVRQPLAKVLVKVETATEREGLVRQASQLLDELNVKELLFIGELDQYVAKLRAKKPELDLHADFVMGIEGLAVAKGGNHWVILDTTITPELAAEGLAREVVHRLQTMRRSAGFDIADHIVTYWEGDETIRRVMLAFADYIRQETLSQELLPGPLPAHSYQESLRASGHSVQLGVARV